MSSPPDMNPLISNCLIPELWKSKRKEPQKSGSLRDFIPWKNIGITEIEKHLGIRLPIILDSPSGKKVDQTNIQLMVNILKRDFSDNQIIIASIFQYDFESLNVIEIQNRLIEE